MSKKIFRWLALGIVVALSWYATAVYMYLTGFHQSFARFAANHAADNVDVLRLLHRGDVQAAIDALDRQVDGNIVVHSGYDEKIDRRYNILNKAAHLPPIGDTQMFDKVVAYRREFPRRFTEPALRSLVERALRGEKVTGKQARFDQ